MRIPFTNFAINISPRGKTTKAGEMISSLFNTQGVRVAPQDLWKIYRINADVFSCIREWRQGVGQAGYKFVNPQDVEVEANKSVIGFLDSFYSASGGFHQIKSLALRDLGICGNAYFEIVKNANGMPYGLHRLDPRSIFIVADAYGQIIKYVQRVFGADPITFDPSEIWHIVIDQDSDNELVGMSPLETALLEARTDIASAQANYHFFENNAVPTVMYILENGIDKASQKEAMEQIKEKFGGAKNMNKSAILSGIKEIKTISMSQKDMEFVVGRKFNTDKICSVFGVAKYILGYTENVNYSNGEGILKKFYQSTLRPLERNYEDATNILFEKIGLKGSVVLSFNPQSFGDELELRRIALEELKSGAITLRQYKIKTGQDITAEDEQETMIDKHVIQNGASAILLDDVGVEPVVNPNDPTTANSIIEALKTHALYESKSN